MKKLSLSLAALAVIVLAAALPGCAITGLDGESKYACKAPEGVRCDSVSGTYYNALQNNLPAPRDGRVAKLMFKAGDNINRGDVLLTLE